MFLSRVELGPSASRHEEFWREVTTPYGAHQALWKLFGRKADQPRDFLYRQEVESGGLRFMVLSEHGPRGDGDGLWLVESKPFAPDLRPGQRLGFRLRASPVVRRGQVREGDAKRVVKRHDLVMDAKRKLASESQPRPDDAILIQEVGLAWLSGQGGKAGFRLAEAKLDSIGEDGLLEAEPASRPAVRVDGYRQHRLRGSRRRGDASIRFSTLDFEGQVEVTEPERFLRQVRQGFGPQKAFGCGLMLLRKV